MLLSLLDLVSEFICKGFTILKQVIVGILLLAGRCNVSGLGDHLFQHGLLLPPVEGDLVLQGYLLVNRIGLTTQSMLTETSSCKVIEMNDWRQVLHLLLLRLVILTVV